MYLNVFFLLSALCPNVINQRHLRTLNYLFYKRFVEVRAVLCVWNDNYCYIYILITWDNQKSINSLWSRFFFFQVLLPSPLNPSGKAVICLCCLPNPLPEELGRMEPFSPLPLKALMLDDITVGSVVIHREGREHFSRCICLAEGMDSWSAVLLSLAFHFLCFGEFAWFKVSKLASYFH